MAKTDAPHLLLACRCLGNDLTATSCRYRWPLMGLLSSDHTICPRGGVIDLGGWLPTLLVRVWSSRAVIRDCYAALTIHIFIAFSGIISEWIKRKLLKMSPVSLRQLWSIYILIPIWYGNSIQRFCLDILISWEELNSWLIWRRMLRRKKKKSCLLSEKWLTF